MRLGPKITLFAGLINIASLVFVYFVFQSVLIGGLRNIEDTRVRTSIDRIREAIQNRIVAVDLKNQSFSTSDETRKVIFGYSSKPQYELANLDLIQIYDKGGKSLYTNIKPVPGNRLDSDSLLIKNALSGKKSSGVILFEEGYLMISARPVIYDTESNKVEGVILAGELLDESLFAEISQQVKISFDVSGVDPIKSELFKVLSSLKSGQLYVLEVPNTTDPIKGYSLFSGVDDSPLFIIEVNTDRELFKEGEKAIRYLVASLVVAGVASMVVLVILFNSIAVGRLRKLEKDVKSIRSLGNFSKRVDVVGVDEIGVLAKDINDMLGSLEISQRLLLEEEQHVKKKVEEQTKEIREGEAKLFASINSVPNGLIITDKEGNLVLVNQATSRILNLKDIPLTLASLQVLFGDSLLLQESYNKCLDTQRPISIDEVKYGSKLLQIYIAPIYFLGDRKNNITGVVILITDITEPKLIERSKDEFFSIASHELRTPLTAIRGNTDLLKKFYFEKFPEDQSFKEMVSDINEASLRLMGIVNEFLTTSRLELGKIEFAKQGFDIEELVASVIHEFSIPAKDKGLAISLVKLSDPLPKVYADRDRVREVFVNLISNAVKYSDTGKIDVKLKWDGDYLQTSVEDTGRGIPLENQNFLFRKFQQAKRNIYARDTASSTGLGLYICKLLIENMGGQIYLEKSEEGVGSTFTFTLPLASE